MAVTPADVRARDITGTFAGLTDPQIQVFIDDAVLIFGTTPGVWPSNDVYELAVIYSTLHTLAGATYGAFSGPVASATAGRLSIDFGASSSAFVGLQTTRWGQLLRGLALQYGVLGPMVASGSALCCSE